MFESSCYSVKCYLLIIPFFSNIDLEKSSAASYPLFNKFFMYILLYAKAKIIFIGCMIRPIGFWAAIADKHIIVATNKIANHLISARHKGTNIPKKREVQENPIGTIFIIPMPFFKFIFIIFTPCKKIKTTKIKVVRELNNYQ